MKALFTIESCVVLSLMSLVATWGFGLLLLITRDRFFTFRKWADEKIAQLTPPLEFPSAGGPLILDEDDPVEYSVYELALVRSSARHQRIDEEWLKQNGFTDSRLGPMLVLAIKGWGHDEPTPSEESVQFWLEFYTESGQWRLSSREGYTLIRRFVTRGELVDFCSGLSVYLKAEPA